MIIKIKSYKRVAFGKLLAYMINNEERLFDKNKRSFTITHNIKGNSLEKWEKQFKENETHRLRLRSDSVRLTHEILSWHTGDSKEITLAKLEDMAREYIRLRNPNGIYVAVPHFDKDHYHVHICASGVEYKTGKSLRLSKEDLHTLKTEIQNYQVARYPELSKSVVAHGKGDKSRLTDEEYRSKLRTNRESKKERVSAILKTCYKKADSRERFFLLLKECGIKTYDRSGKTTGVFYEDIKIRFSRLGFTEERLVELDKTKERTDSLSTLRAKEPLERIKTDKRPELSKEAKEERLSELDALRSKETPEPPQPRLGR